MNELVNDGIKLSKLEINNSFINGLQKKWLAFCQSLRNTNYVKESELDSLFGKLKYEENLINSIYDTNKEKTLVPATPLSTAFFSSSIIQDFQNRPDDEEDTSSQEYMNDLFEEYQARALLAKSKRFFKKGTQRFSSAKATDQIECPNVAKRHNPEPRHTKDFEAKYNKVKTKLALISSSTSAPSSSSCKNKGLITKTYDWDKEEVSSNDNEVTEVKALMAFVDEERVSFWKESAVNGGWIKISITFKKKTREVQFCSGLLGRTVEQFVLFCGGLLDRKVTAVCLLVTVVWIDGGLQGKDNGENILQSIDEGPFKIGKFRETLAEGALHLRPKRDRVFAYLTQKKRRDIWDNVKMLLEGSKLTNDERESQLYDDFKHLRQNKGETIYEYYVRGLKTSNYDQMYAYLKQHDAHANENKMMLERYNQRVIDSLAFVSNVLPQQYLTQSSPIPQSLYGRQNSGQGNNAKGAVVAGNEGFQKRVGNTNPGQAKPIKFYKYNGIDEEQLLFIVDGLTIMFDDDVDEAPAPTAQTMFMANLSLVDLIYDEVGLSYDSDIRLPNVSLRISKTK
uniref:Retrovirus-related Pol polyprotein from transposon TNT 1-94 n=1 Tax=Tanacetum cinerariifolium TaxID=118510 RepID=A0A6L2KIX1_TANCI|nr:hypothetical protein [Tanacetum cinerariifolium]